MVNALLGLITGTLVCLTGTGDGVLLTPLLLVLTPYPAVVVIGTDIVSGALTKLLGVFDHRRLSPLATRPAADRGDSAGDCRWNLAYQVAEISSSGCPSWAPARPFVRDTPCGCSSLLGNPLVSIAALGVEKG